MDWNISCGNYGNVFNWIYRMLIVFIYPIFCNYYLDYKSDRTLLSSGFRHNI